MQGEFLPLKEFEESGACEEKAVVFGGGFPGGTVSYQKESSELRRLEAKGTIAGVLLGFGDIESSRLNMEEPQQGLAFSSVKYSKPEEWAPEH